MSRKDWAVGVEHHDRRFSFHTYLGRLCALSPLFELRIEIDLTIPETGDRRRFCDDVVPKVHTPFPSSLVPRPLVPTECIYLYIYISTRL